MDTSGSPAHGRQRFLTRADVARLFEVSPATVARWSREGKLPFVRTPGGQRRYLRDRIVACWGLLVGHGEPEAEVAPTERRPHP
jgi:excisionase family DNA binding protein